MAAIHFTSISCEPVDYLTSLIQPVKDKGGHIFAVLFSSANHIVYSKFEDFRTFLCVFMSIV